MSCEMYSKCICIYIFFYSFFNVLRNVFQTYFQIHLIWKYMKFLTRFIETKVAKYFILNTFANIFGTMQKRKFFTNVLYSLIFIHFWKDTFSSCFYEWAELVQNKLTPLTCNYFAIICNHFIFIIKRLFHPQKYTLYQSCALWMFLDELEKQNDVLLIILKVT